MKKEVLEAIRTINAWAEENPESHAAFAALYDKSGEGDDTFVSVVGGKSRSIAAALAYTACKSPGFEKVLNSVVEGMPESKAAMAKESNRHTPEA